MQAILSRGSTTRGNTHPQFLGTELRQHCESGTHASGDQRPRVMAVAPTRHEESMHYGEHIKRPTREYTMKSEMNPVRSIPSPPILPHSRSLTQMTDSVTPIAEVNGVFDHTF